MLGSGGHPRGDGASSGLYYRRWFAFIARVRVAVVMGGFKSGWNQTAWEVEDAGIVRAWVEESAGGGGGVTFHNRGVPIHITTIKRRNSTDLSFTTTNKKHVFPPDKPLS